MHVALAGGGAALALAAAGCGSSDKTPEAPEAPQEAETFPALYGAFPADAEFLVGVSLASVRDSELWEAHRSEVLHGAGLGSSLAAVTDACGFDPLSEVDDVVIGGNSEPGGEFVFVVQGITREQVKACVDGAAQVQGDGYSVEDEGDLARYVLGGTELWAGWLGETTVALAPQETSSKQNVERRVEGQGGLGDTGGLAALIDQRIDRDKGLWLGLIPSDTSEIGRGLAGAADSTPRSIYGTVDASGVLDVDMGIEFATAGEAEELREGVEQMLQIFKLQGGDLATLLGGLELSTENEHLAAQVSLTADEVDTLLDAVADMLLGPAMHGHGGDGAGAPAPPPGPAGPGPGHDVGEPVEVEDMEAFAEAYLELQEIEAELEGDLEAAGPDDDVAHVHERAIEDAREVVEAKGMDLVTYAQILQRIETDPELREEFEKVLGDDAPAD